MCECRNLFAFKQVVTKSECGLRMAALGETQECARKLLVLQRRRSLEKVFRSFEYALEL